LPGELCEKIKAERAKFPDLGLTEISSGKWKGKHHYQYFGKNAEHKKYLVEYMKKRIDSAKSKAEKFAAMTYRALLDREGSTSSWNTFDNQIVTWGTGFGAVGALPLVLNQINKSDGAKQRLRAVGFLWDDKKGYFIADPHQAKVLKSKSRQDHKEAADAWRAQTDLLSAMSGLAEHPDTRDVITEANFQAYKTNSASFNADPVQTAGLFGLVSHLHHWYPAFAKVAWKHAVDTAGGGGASEAQDCALAKAFAKKFFNYGNANLKSPMNEAQLRGYVRDAKKDGLSSLETEFSFNE
jgi:hypothetical protein